MSGEVVGICVFGRLAISIVVGIIIGVVSGAVGGVVVIVGAVGIIARVITPDRRELGYCRHRNLQRCNLAGHNRWRRRSRCCNCRWMMRGNFGQGCFELDRQRGLVR